MNLILSIGFSITGFTILLLLQKKINKSINKFAVFILLLWFVRFVILYMKGSNFDFSGFPIILFLDQNLFFLDGVFIYWFAKSLNKEPFKLINQIGHLSFFFIGMFLSLSLVFVYSNDQLLMLYEKTEEGLNKIGFTPDLEETIFILLILIHNFIYIFLAYKKIKKYNSYILSNYSNIDRIQVNWLTIFIKIWVVLFIIPLFFYFLNYIKPIVNLNTVEFLFISCLVIESFYFSTYIIGQNYVALHQTKNTKISKINYKYDENKQNEDFQILKKLMAEEKPYLDSDLTLAKLSLKINLKPLTLSQLIKTKTSGNFYEFINTYRIKSIKKDLINSQEQIIIIAYNNGFNSKSTFNKVFKQSTGLSPSQFRKNNTKTP